MADKFEDPTLQGNEKIKEAIHLFHQEQTNERYDLGCFAVRERMIHSCISYWENIILAGIDLIFFLDELSGQQCLIWFSENSG